MRAAEALWIKGILERQSSEMLSPVLELGSSTTHFRTVTHPHIEKTIHAPLRNRNIDIITSDLKEGDGVDVSGNIYEKEVRKTLKDFRPGLILCCNILEHVCNPRLFADICDDILPPGGHILVTVPNSYPYHDDPIDTGFRPSVDQIHGLFANYELIEGNIIDGGSYSSDLIRKRGIAGLPITVSEILIKIVFPAKASKWKSRNHPLLWLWRDYKVAGTLLRKPG